MDIVGPVISFFFSFYFLIRGVIFITYRKSKP